MNCLQTDTDISCAQKTSVTVPASYGLLKKFDVTITSSDILLQFEVTKSAPILEYPLRYLHTVPYYPVEKVTKAPHPISGCGIIDCNDPNGFSIVRDMLDLESLFGSCPFRGEELFAQPATIISKENSLTFWEFSLKKIPDAFNSHLRSHYV